MKWDFPELKQCKSHSVKNLKNRLAFRGRLIFPCASFQKIFYKEKSAFLQATFQGFKSVENSMKSFSSLSNGGIEKMSLDIKTYANFSERLWHRIGRIPSQFFKTGNSPDKTGSKSKRKVHHHPRAFS